MVLLGCAVRDGPTPLDDWFQHANGTALGLLLFFTDHRTVGVILLGALAGALYRRQWLLAAAVVLVPVAAVELARLLKPLFGRWKGDGLAYPSGHTTLLTVVLGMVVLVAGARPAVLWGCAVFGLLGVLGQAVTYHYFTDAVGAVLLGTSVVCLVATALRAAGFDGCLLWAHDRDRR
jgi:hypothetical protein